MKENVIQINGGITVNVDVYVENLMYKKYIWNTATCNSENGKYLAGTMDNSAIMCDKIIESYNEETNYFNNF